MSEHINRIKVPEHFKSELKVRNEHDPEYRLACIRDHIKNNPGKIIDLKEFSYIAYGHYANGGYCGRVLKKLIKEGRVTRTKVTTKTKGRHFSYQWHDKRPEGWKKHGEVQLVKKINSRESVFDVERIEEEAKSFSWNNNTDSLRDFVKHLKGEL